MKVVDDGLWPGSGVTCRLWSIRAVLVLALVACSTHGLAAAQNGGRDERLVRAAERFVADLIKNAQEIVSRNLDPAFIQRRHTRPSAVRSPANGKDHAPSSADTASRPSGGSIVVRSASSTESAAVASAVPELKSFLRRHFDWSAIRDIVSAGLEHELGYVPLTSRDVEEEVVQKYALLFRSVLFFYSGQEVIDVGVSKAHPNGDVTVDVDLSSPTVRPLSLSVRVRSTMGNRPLVVDIGHEGLSLLQVARAREFEKWLARALPGSSSQGAAPPKHE